MNFITKTILGIPVTIGSKAKILEEVEKYLKEFRIQNSEFRIKRPEPLVIFTPNPEIIEYAQHDYEFRKIVASAQINLPDGWGTVWGIKRIHGIRLKRLAGIDFMEELCRLSAKKSFVAGFIGGMGGVAVEAAECLRAKVPGLWIYAFEPPQMEVLRGDRVSGIKYLVSSIKNENILNTKYKILNTRNVELQNREYFESLIKQIDQNDIDVLFVALGFPKQEYFINYIRQYLMISAPNQSRFNPPSRKSPAVRPRDAEIFSASSDFSSDEAYLKNPRPLGRGSFNRDGSGQAFRKPLVLMAVGGSLDYLSGRQKRAPNFLRKHGLEWMWRLLIEPRRFKRQLAGGRFFLRILLLRAT